MKGVLPLTIVMVLSLVGCGSDDGGESESTQPSERATASPDTLSAEGVEFTFSIAEGGTQVDARDDVLAAVLLDPADVNNGVKVRQAAPEPLSSESYIETIRQQFEADLGVEVEFTTETHAGTEMAVLSYEGKQGSIDQSVRNYFFPGSTATWHIECISTEQATRAAVDRLCAEALDTLVLD